MNRNKLIEQQANEIEAELKQLGYWQTTPAQQFLFYRPVPGKADALETQGGGDGRETHLVQLLQRFDDLFAPRGPEE